MKSARVFYAGITVLLTCMVSGSGAWAGQQEDLSNKTFYTTANIWYEHADNIASTNYHKGQILPLGTRVTEVEVGNGMEWQSQFNSGIHSTSLLSQGPEGFSREMIRFYNEQKKKYVIYFVKKHMGNMALRDFFHQYFSEEDTLRPDGPFQKLSPHEKELVRMGEIEVGMSKAAVLMSYGYPPGNRTPSLTRSLWVYPIGRIGTVQVYFLDDKVNKIK